MYTAKERDFLMQYPELARKTAIYPRKYAVSYPIHGLISEVGELQQEIQIGANPVTITKELGDCYWYIANIALDMNIGLDFVAFEAITSRDIPIIMMNLQILTGVLSGKYKKCQRDGDGFISNFMAPGFAENLISIAQHLLAIARIFNVSLPVILGLNISKLSSRKERGVLGGSGDDR